MRPPRGLSAEEAEAWAALAATVVPINPPRNGEGDRSKTGGGAPSVTPTLSATSDTKAAMGAKHTRPEPPRVPLHPRPFDRLRTGGPPPRSGADGLDSHWERRLGAGTLQPDFTLDLHGHGLDAAHGRLMGGMTQARAMGARVVLLIAGKSRPSEAADRGTQRGAIRAKVLDWLAASSHSTAIAAIRKAHRRHGGEGALYIVLRKER